MREKKLTRDLDCESRAEEISLQRRFALDNLGRTLLHLV